MPCTLPVNSFVVLALKRCACAACRMPLCVSQRLHVEATLIDQRKELLAEHEGLEVQDSARLEVLSGCFKLFRYV